VDLNEAVCSAPVQQVKEMIDRGTDINVTDDKGFTPLHWAAMCGRMRVVHVLLENGARIDAKAHSGWTPLHGACANLPDSTLAAKLLIQRGADVNAREHQDRTPLHLAGGSADPGLIQMFLDNGADINAKDEFGTIVLCDAIDS